MFWRTMAGAVVVSVALSGVCYADDNGKNKEDPAPDQSLVRQGFAISPIPADQLNMAGKDPDMVGLGSYFVNAAADCNGCHSFPRFLPAGMPGSNPAYTDPYLGMPIDQPLTDAPLHANFNVKHMLAGGRCFGSIMSRNITPDANGLPSGLTEADFIRVMRTGKDVYCDEKNPTDPICNLPEPTNPNPKELQTMSWPTYHGMTDRDLKAIYAYLTALPHRDACNTPADGCPPFSGLAAGKPTYQYQNADGTCPNPPTPQ